VPLCLCGEKRFPADLDSRLRGNDDKNVKTPCLPLFFPVFQPAAGARPVGREIHGHEGRVKQGKGPRQNNYFNSIRKICILEA